ncbi:MULTISPECIES: DUF4381 domain-containing protein [unclassified Pseudomonas]|uniref:DUF4381 domain-containing protein n=1 Tax=unclassified Pseudomonas TaxID=196821 RepID=UPI00244D25A0|nr:MULTISPECIES: DUF4381 domain-containing protein [unclassified Pseudomonas]MDG9925681.1 DUF4381 domain-containing protein [Pseudomonas sp. GD04045]MDH0037202.1 DUF4381 domain-containing protein [Pseudomonas sp. GD04019]
MSTDNTPHLDQLKELALPAPPVSYWPQTWGWLVLASLLLLALAAWGIWCWWRWRRDRYRREAIARLAEIERALGDDARRLAALRELPELLKRVALSMPDRPQVATLHGSAWQHFLQQRSPTPLPEDFSHHLATLAYAPAPHLATWSREQQQTLLAHARRWIETHHVAV